MSKRLLSWASNTLTDAVLANQPVGVDTYVHDGPGVLRVGHNWLRIPRQASLDLPRDHELQAWYWGERWRQADARFEALALDELKLGGPEDGLAGWVAQLDYLRYYCDRLVVPMPRLALAWNVLTGDQARIRETLAALRDRVDVWVAELYLASDQLVAMTATAEAMMDAAADVGLWPNTVLLWNWSDKPEWLASGSHYAVFGAVDADVTPVLDGYERLWRYAAMKGLPLGHGYWSTQYLSPRSVAAYETLLDRVGWYRYPG